METPLPKNIAAGIEPAATCFQTPAA